MVKSHEITRQYMPMLPIYAERAGFGQKLARVFFSLTPILNVFTSVEYPQAVLWLKLKMTIFVCLFVKFYFLELLLTQLKISTQGDNGQYWSILIENKANWSWS